MNRRARLTARKGHTRKARPDLKSLQDRETRQKFLDAVVLPPSGDTTTEEKSADFVAALQKATDVLPREDASPAAKNPWANDEELLRLIDERKKLLLTDKSGYRRKQRQIRKRAAALRNEHFENEALLLNAAKEARQLEAAYVRAKEQVSVLRRKPPTKKCPNLAEHFRSHFNPDHSSHQTPPYLADASSAPKASSAIQRRQKSTTSCHRSWKS